MSEPHPVDNSCILAFVAEALVAIDRAESPITEVRKVLAMINDQVAAADVRQAHVYANGDGRRH